MDTALIAGIDSVVGANLATILSDRFSVVGLSFSGPISIAGCATSVCSCEDTTIVRNWVATVRPQWIVCCVAGAHSTWHELPAAAPDSQTVNACRAWSLAARDFGARLTLISSDAVFTGPWMFHKEESLCLCDSGEARILRTAEQETIKCCPEALVVRTNAYGWAPVSHRPGWIEQTLSALERRIAGPFDSLRHATPILATDLAEILADAYREKLEGIYHIAGAERVNPVRFVDHLAEQFALPAPLQLRVDSLAERPTEFGRSETSLHVNKIRKALNIALPMLDDGLKRLFEQRQEGYCRRFDATDESTHEEKVA